MKRAIVLVLALLIMLCTCSVAVFATAPLEAYTIVGDLEKVLCGEVTFVPFDMGSAFVSDWRTARESEVIIDDAAMKKYSSVMLYSYSSIDYLLYVVVTDNNGNQRTVYFIRESNYAECAELVATGEIRHGCRIESIYTYDSYFYLDSEELSVWMNTGGPKKMSVSEMKAYDSTAVYAVDSGGGIMTLCGTLFMEPYPEDRFDMEIYLLLHSGLGDEFFDSYGDLDLSYDGEAVFYPLTDGDTLVAVGDFLTTEPDYYEIPGMEVFEGLSRVMRIMLNIVLPIGGMVVAVVIMAKTRARMPYGAVCTLAIIGCALVIIGYIATECLS